MIDEVLLEIQHNFPLVKSPFLKIAQKFQTTENEVIRILKEQKESGVIRQTSAIFDTKKLGYTSSLVAFCVDETNIEECAKNINTHPGVSHNYQRSHIYNLWFTIAVPPNSIIGLEKTVEYFASKAGVTDYLILPTKKMFKIAVKLDTTKQKSLKEEMVKKTFSEITLTQEHYDLIELLQKDIEFIQEPFFWIIEKLGITYEKFFELFMELQKSGVMRRFASILNHKKAGFTSNAMVVWEIDDEKGDEIGSIASHFSAVSHCYLRPVFESWKYNLFTMIHANSEKELENIIEMMGNEIASKSNFILHSIKEFKKVRIIYFSNEFAIWEEKYAIS